ARDKTPARTEPTLSLAERISRLQRSLEKDQDLLKNLKAQLDDPAGEYPQAQAQFKELDKQLAALKKQITVLREAGKQGEAAALSEGTLVTLQEEWQTARDRFDLAIQERKILQGKMAVLRQTIQQDQQRLDRLTGTGTEPEPHGAAAAEAGRGKTGCPDAAAAAPVSGAGAAKTNEASAVPP